MEVVKILKDYKLTKEEYLLIKKRLKREPTPLELAIFDAMWSEHCSYKSSKALLQNFLTDSLNVVQGPGENAGIVDIGGSHHAVFKIESHNHPSQISPHNGAATGVGGIIRDILSMGAKPLATLNSLRFGDPNGEDSKYQKYLLDGISSGIGSYGNCIGIPTVGGEVTFDANYDNNVVVNVFNIGLVAKDKVVYSKTGPVDSIIIYVGGKTGKDGLGGAVMSSSSFKNSKKKRSTVQIANPLCEKLLLDACLELFKYDYIYGAQDLGAAGLVSSTFEMVHKSSSGLKLYLDKVPLREKNMSPVEILLSESQERMIISAKRSKFDKIKKIFDHYNIECEIIGKVIKSEKIEIYNGDELLTRLPVQSVMQSPILDRKATKPSYIEELDDIPSLDDLNINETFVKLFSSLNVVDKSYIYSQYDSSIKSSSIKVGGELGASVLKIKGEDKDISISSECNPLQCYVDPKRGTELAIIRSARNIVLSGGEALAMTNCLNFGNPENSEVMWQLQQSCDGISTAGHELNIPVVSGNVSLYNGTGEKNIYPTPTIVTVGVIKNGYRVINSKLKKLGNTLFLLGDRELLGFGGSLLYKEMFGVVSGHIEDIDFDLEKRVIRTVKRLYEEDILLSSKNIGLGGTVVALAKMISISDYGVIMNPYIDDLLLFSESEHRVIVEVSDEDYAKNIFDEYEIPYSDVGTICDDGLIYGEDIHYSSKELKNIYFNTLSDIIDIKNS